MESYGILREKIIEAFRAEGCDDNVAHDIAFHMLDWDDDLKALLKFYEHPDAFTNREIVRLIDEFLIHAPDHLVAAKKLAGAGATEDVFEVGIFVEDD